MENNEINNRIINIKDLIDKIELNSTRRDGEEWEKYKKRRKYNKILLDTYLKGINFYYSDILTQHNIDIDTNRKIPYYNMEKHK